MPMELEACTSEKTVVIGIYRLYSNIRSHLMHSFMVEVLNWSFCSPDLSPTENIWIWWNTKYDKEDQAEFQYQAPKSPTTLLLSSQMFIGCCWKKRGSYTVVNIALAQFFFRCLASYEPVHVHSWAGGPCRQCEFSGHCDVECQCCSW